MKNINASSLLRAAGIPEVQWLLEAVANPAVLRSGWTSLCSLPREGLQELVSLQLTEAAVEFPNLCLNRGIQTSKPGSA